MRRWVRTLALVVALGWTTSGVAGEMPKGFVYLRDVDSSIAQDMRYARSHNFIGRPVAGYGAAECVLTKQAAAALRKVQAALKPQKLSLIVWDCYRPARAVADFKAWSALPSDQKTKAEFYPNEDKANFFVDGYLASRSKHSSGSTVDLGIVPLAAARQPVAPVPATLVACTAPKGKRYDDRTIDFGTGHDCLDDAATYDNPSMSKVALANRKLLRDAMGRAGFVPYRREWWHFELKNEPFPKRYFDFPITPR